MTLKSQQVPDDPPLPVGPPPLVVGPDEAAPMLRISRSRLFELIAAGEIRSFKVGRLRRISIAALEEWIKAQDAA